MTKYVLCVVISMFATLCVSHYVCIPCFSSVCILYVFMNVYFSHIPICACILSVLACLILCMFQSIDLLSCASVYLYILIYIHIDACLRAAER